MDVIQLGSLTLKWDLLALIGALVLALVAISLRLKLESKPVKPWMEWAMTVMLVLLLNEKFGYLWDSPSVIWEQPKALLFLSGTSINGNVLLVIGLVSWSILYVRKHQLSLAILTDLAAQGYLMWLVGYGFLYAYMNETAPGMTPFPLPGGIAQALPPIESFIAIVVLLVLWLLRRPLGSLKDAQYSTAFMGTAGLLLSLWIPPEIAWMSMSSNQWLYVFLLICCYFITRERERRKLLMQAEQEWSEEKTIEEAEQAKPGL